MAEGVLPTNLSAASPAEERKSNSKRRSLLVQPGTILAATRKASGDRESPVRAKPRPVTMFNPSITSLAELAAQFGDESEGGADTYGDERRDKQTKAARESALTRLTGEGDGSKSRHNGGNMGPPPKPGGRTALTRTQSLRKSQMDATKASNGKPEARNASTTSRISRPLSTLQESATASQLSRPGSSASTASAESYPGPNRARLPSIPQSSTAAPNNLALRRSATTTARHTRAQSALTASTATGPSGLPRLELASSARRRTPTVSSEMSPPSSTPSSSGPNSASLPQPNRPAFTMHQQHYSPRKNLAPKPLTSSIMNAAAPSESNSPGLETQLLQTQLLQLSLLHMQFGPTYRAWLRSARKKLGHKFEETAQWAEVVRQEESDLRLRRNVAALRLWGASADGKDGGFAELVQSLAGIVNEVTLLAEEGGRVERAVGEFEWWVARTEDIWARREDCKAAAEFVDGLGDEWRAEVGALLRRLGNLKRVIEFLPPAKKASSLEEIVSGFGQLINGLLEELALLLRTEALIVEKEKQWVDERIVALASEIGIVIPAG